MLELGPNLNLDRLAPCRRNDVNRSVAEARLFPPVDYDCLREHTLQSFHKLILHEHIRHNQTASGDILHLAQPDCLPAEFFYYRSRGFRWSSCWFQLRRAPDDSGDFFVRPCKRPTISIKLAKIALRNLSLSKAVTELVHLRLGKRAHKIRTRTPPLCPVNRFPFELFPSIARRVAALERRPGLDCYGSPENGKRGSRKSFTG